jgi:hypothetical protein
MDFFTVPTVTGRFLFVLVLLAHQRRRIVHVAITDHPTAAWTAQQIIEAFPDDTAARWLVTRPPHVGCSRRPRGACSRFQKSADYIIATSGVRPDGRRTQSPLKLPTVKSLRIRLSRDPSRQPRATTPERIHS